MKIYISQPMAGKTDEEIEYVQEEIFNYIAERYGEADILSSQFLGMKDLNEVEALGKAIELMSKADIVLFAPDWMYSHGCTVEAEVTKEYAIPAADLSDILVIPEV